MRIIQYLLKIKFQWKDFLMFLYYWAFVTIDITNGTRNLENLAQKDLYY